MSGVRRFLSRREKSPSVRHSHHEKEKRQHQQQAEQPQQPEHFAGVFTEKPDLPIHNGHVDKKTEKEHDKKVKAIVERLRHLGVNNITEENVEYALHHVTPQGDTEAAYKLLWLLENTYEGIVTPYDPTVKLVGAVNRQGTTCFLDALLFSMFVRLDSFEAMLYENYTDAKQKRLGALLRLWVNLLRSGRLITTDVTAHIQETLAGCGWADAAKCMQQDPSEAFTFITGQLQLPMLTLKMDMFHTGKEDPQDDHKFVNERLLEVALLDTPIEGRSVITLEDCLEHYFNNRIEVKRHLENQRRNTIKSGQAPPFLDGYIKADKEPGMHIEVAEVPETPIAASPAAMTPIVDIPKTPAEMLRPTSGRKRQDSIFSQRKVELIGIDPEALTKTDSHVSQQELPGRKLSTRTEVLMPAWQFFKLLPWYTDNMPTSDAQVAAHFSRQRPLLGICLKRYSYTNDGQERKRDDYVDIPLEIAVPNFVGGDDLEGHGHGREQLGGNFHLMLQSVVCHRGVSVHSGHYVALCRSQTSNSRSRRGSVESEDPEEDPWMRFDDLASERVTKIDIHEALRRESPYLLFYQVQPIDEDGGSIPEHQLPSYSEATSRSQSEVMPWEKPLIHEPPPDDATLAHIASDPSPLPPRPSTDTTGGDPMTETSSLNPSPTAELHRGRTGPQSTTDKDKDKDLRRKSVTLDTSSVTGSLRTDPTTSNSVPSTPSEEKSNPSSSGGGGFLNVAAGKFTGSRRGSKVAPTNTTDSSSSRKPASRSRPASTDRGGGGTNRLSLNMTRLTQMMSKGQTNGGSSTTALPANEDGAPVLVPSEAVARELAGQTPVAPDSQQRGSVGPTAPPVAPPAPDEPEVPGGSERETVGQRALALQPPMPPQTVPPQSKKERKKLKAQAQRQGGKGEEERECAIM